MLPKLMQYMDLPHDAPAPSRRRFLIGAAAGVASMGAGLVVGFRPAVAATPAKSGEPAGPLNPLEAYVHITPDDRVTVVSSQFDMGQGSWHGIATLVVEELDADWSTVTVTGGAGDPAVFGNVAWGGTAQGTGGSTSMVSSWQRYRQAGATARAMLVAAAARAWDVPESEIAVTKGLISHHSGKSARFGALAADAATLPVPADVPLKAPSAWTEIGNADRRRYDTAPKTRGELDFTIDVRLPGLLTAVMIHPPRFGATLTSFDAAAAKAVKGVVDVVATPRGVAVVAEHMWAAIKGRDLVKVDWDESKAETRGSDAILAEYRALAAQAPKAVARNDGDAAAALGSAATVIEATYSFPYLAHAAMEPLNAVARGNPDGTVEVWAGHQLPGLYRFVASKVAGTTPDKVGLHVMKTGGGFGRRAVDDADVIVEAVAVARAIGWRAPVKVQWTREDDMRGGRYRPAYVHRLRAGLDADGRLVGWDNHIVGQSIGAGTPFEAMVVHNGVDHTSVEGAANLPYAIPNLSVGLTTTDVKVPVLWWRSVGSTHTAFATETFIDEVAAAAGRDPVEFRLSLLSDRPRHAAVLKLAAEKAGWGKPLPAGRFRGVAVHESFSTAVAQVAEVSVDGDGVRVHRVVCAVDCGVAINPDNVKAQIEGGIGFGLGAILAEELTLTDGVVDQGNYDGYTPLRIDAMPAVEVHILPSDAPPTGVGEPGVPPIGPAVANAVAAATGKRIRDLPFSRGLASA